MKRFLKKKYRYIIIILYSSLILLPFLLDPHILKQNDLDEITFNLRYIKWSLYTYHQFPLWEPFANQGIPLPADPLNSLFNPLVGIPFLLLPFDYAIKTTYLITTILSAFVMYYVLRKFEVHKNIAFITSLTYISSGYLASRIIAAHFLLLSYPFLPLVIYSLFILMNRKNIIWSTILGLSLTIILFSVDIYGLMYSGIMIVITLLYAIYKKKPMVNFFYTLSIFCFLSAIKLLPFIELPNYITKVREPFTGSQNIISILYYLFIPIKPLFKLVHLNQFIVTNYAWWEKIAFIGILPLITLILFFKIYRKIKIQNKIVFILILLVILLISMPASLWNPLHYIVTNLNSLQIFHVPSRVFAYFDCLLLLLQGIVSNFYYKKNKTLLVAILIFNLVITTAFFEGIFLKWNQPVLGDNTTPILQQLKKKDPSVFYLSQNLSSQPIPRYIVMDNNTKMIQNYAFMIKKSPAEDYNLTALFIKKQYNDIPPKYILADKGKKPKGREKLETAITYHNEVIYKNLNYIPYAFITDGKTKKEISANIGINHITVHATGTKSFTRLVLLESYFPGWNLTIDGKETPLINNRFLQAPLLKGNHTYVFQFTSILFLYGTLISVLSFIVLIYFGIRYRKVIINELSIG